MSHPRIQTTDSVLLIHTIAYSIEQESRSFTPICQQFAVMYVSTSEVMEDTPASMVRRVNQEQVTITGTGFSLEVCAQEIGTSQGCVIVPRSRLDSIGDCNSHSQVYVSSLKKCADR